MRWLLLMLALLFDWSKVIAAFIAPLLTGVAVFLVSVKARQALKRS